MEYYAEVRRCWIADRHRHYVQSNILNYLSTFALSPEHVFYDSQSNYQQALGQSLFPQLATVSQVPMLGLALDYRSNEAKAPSSPLSITTSGPDTDYPFFGDIRDQLNVTPATIQPKSWLYGVRLDATRELRRDLTGYAGISYSVAGEFGGQDRIIRLTCKLAKTLDSYLTASYLQRESSGEIVANVPMSDFTTIIGIRRTFGP